MIYYCYIESPIGDLLLAGKHDQLHLIGFPHGKMARQPEPGWEHNPAPFQRCIQQFKQYFAGQRTNFELKYELNGSAFAKQVLQRIASVPYGSTTSYSNIAAQINNPKAVRAVGTAAGNNNLPIVIPCHRIVGKNGSLCGFGGGLETKQFLLELERKNLCA